MKFTFLSVCLLLGIVNQTYAKCCGRGSHGFCNDCTKVGLFKKQKCCHAGGYHNSCNIFCCNCAACASGYAHTRKISGWWLTAKYSCALTIGDNSDIDGFSPIADQSSDAKIVFNQFDKDNDNNLSPVEFADAMATHLNLDKEGVLSFVSQLLQSDNQDDIVRFLDNFDSEESDYGAGLIAKEFIAMDTNKDQKIQANEFDSELP